MLQTDYNPFKCILTSLWWRFLAMLPVVLSSIAGLWDPLHRAKLSQSSKVGYVLDSFHEKLQKVSFSCPTGCPVLPSAGFELWVYED